MEKDFDSWYRHRCLDVQSPLLNSSGARLQNNFSAYMIPHHNGISTNGNFPLSSFAAPMQFKANQPNEPRNRFHGLPCDLNPLLLKSVITKEKDPSGSSFQNLVGVGNPNNITGYSQRKFLVLDQSGDQTTLLYSSAKDAPAQGPPPWLRKPSMAYNLINKESPLGCFLGEECVEENQRGVDESEMREDTEELNALLYSDDDDGDGDYSEGDEEMSTGHSPSTMTDHNERSEEVASSDEPTKRQKLFDGSYDVVPWPADNATSGKQPFGCSELDDDAESSCGNNHNHQVSGRKRSSRKEKIRETISMLQKIIPGGRKGKDAMDVIDGTIHYLKSLKVEAKSLRLDAL